MTSDEIRRTFLEFFEARDHRRLPSASLIPAEFDPSALFTVAGMHPAEALLPGGRAAAASARDDLPEDLPHRRHRDHRHDHPAPDVLRDAGQLLVRRLLQARGGAVRLGALARGLRLPGRGHLDHRVRRRRRARPRSRPGGDRGLAGDRRAARADRRVPALGELLADRPDRSVRAVLGAVPRPRSRVRQARRPSRRGQRALPGVLEPGVHAVRPEPGRRADAAAGQEHRHRPGAQPDGVRSSRTSRRCSRPTSSRR